MCGRSSSNRPPIVFVYHPGSISDQIALFAEFIFQQFKQFLLDLAVRQTTVAIRFAIYRNCLGSSEMYIWRKYGMQPGLLDLQGVLSR